MKTDFTPYELSKQATAKAGAAFEEALRSAQLPYELCQLALLSDVEELALTREVDRMLYEPQLPNAGDRERWWVKRLNKLAQKKDWPYHNRAFLMAAAWQKMLPDNPRHPGRYYVRHAIPGNAVTINDAGENTNERRWVTALRDAAATAHEWEHYWFWQMVLDGPPQSVSDFEVEALFALRSWDNKVKRLVRLTNINGEVSPVMMIDAEALHSPQKFRQWCLSVGNFSWAGNEKAIEKLHEDLRSALVFRMAEEVDACGWHQVGKGAGKNGGLLSGIWFFEECAYADGIVILPDADGIYWHEGHAYYLSERGRESEFLQGRPSMRPTVKVEDLDLKPLVTRPTTDPDSAHGATQPPLAEENLQQFFRDLCAGFYDTLGGFEGYIVLAAMFAYAAAPEIFAQYGFFPGLWAAGQMGSGKTSIMEWAMALWGFSHPGHLMTSGIGIIKATPVGLLQEAQNYSNLPIWIDEWRQAEVGPEKISILRDAYNRQPPAKWSVTGIQRKMKTMYCVSGESTSTDAAMRSRYSHVQISAQSRLNNHLAWFTAQKKNFYVFGRVLMERRPEFVRLVRYFLDQWLKHPATAKLNEREKMGHGIHWASWMAMVSLLESHSPDETAAFKSFMLDHAARAASDVTSETNINIFWMDLITAWKAGEIDVDCFLVESEYQEFDPGGPRVGIESVPQRWNSQGLFIDPEQTIAQLQIYMSKQRGSVTLKRKDLRDQLSKTPYWINGTITKRFRRGGTGGTTAWGVLADKHPLGFQEGVTDEQFQAYLKDRKSGDPRQGPLYTLIQEVELARKKRETEESP